MWFKFWLCTLLISLRPSPPSWLFWRWGVLMP